MCGCEVPPAPQGPALPLPLWLRDGNQAEDETTSTCGDSTSFYDPSQQWFSPPFEYVAQSLLLKCVLLLYVQNALSLIFYSA